MFSDLSIYLILGTLVGIFLVKIYEKYGTNATISHLIYLLKEFGDDYSPPEFRIALQLYNLLDDFLEDVESAVDSEEELMKVIKSLVQTHKNQKKLSEENEE